MNRHTISSIAITLMSAFALYSGIAGADGAEVYRWVDANGNVHYGDRTSAGAKEVQIKTTGAADTATPSENAAELVRGKHCELARKRLGDYENSDRLIQEDEFGRTRDVSGEERVEVILRAQRDVQAFCGEQSAATAATPVPDKAPAAASDEPPVVNAPPAADTSPAAPSASTY